MQAHNTPRIRAGAMVLATSALLFAAFPLIRPFFADPDVNSPASLTVAAQTVISTAWVLAHVLSLVAFVLLIFGMLTLYAYLTHSPSERRAFLALIFSLAGIPLILPALGIEAFTRPAIGQAYLAGKIDVVAVVDLIYGGPGALLLLLGFLLLALGGITFALAIWQSGILPKGAGVLFALGLAFRLPLFPQSIRVVDGLLIGVGGVWIAWSIWQHYLEATQGSMQLTPR